MSNDPLICEVTRGTMVESRHRVHAMIADADGVRAVWGSPDLMFYPRSAIKFMQALPLIESGAADKFAVTGPETALASASHSGASEHVDGVAAFLKRLGLDADALGCGAHLPYDMEAAHALVRQGLAPTRLHNNCSGKHAGFLATALTLGETTQGYLDPDHPVQKRLYDILTDLGGEDLAGTGRGIDGCGIPVYGMTLRALVRAAQRMADPHSLGAVRGGAADRVLDAVSTHPYLVAGRGRFDTDVMTAFDGEIATKGGAEGVHVAILRKHKIGIVLKTADGEKRAGDVAMAWLLEQVGVFNDARRKKLQAHISPRIVNAAGTVAGTIRIAARE